MDITNTNNHTYILEGGYMKVRDKVKIVYDDVEIIFKGQGAFNKYGAYADDLNREDIDFVAYWKVGFFGIRWSPMHHIGELKNHHIVNLPSDIKLSDLEGKDEGY